MVMSTVRMEIMAYVIGVVTGGGGADWSNPLEETLGCGLMPFVLSLPRINEGGE